MEAKTIFNQKLQMPQFQLLKMRQLKQLNGKDLKADKQNKFKQETI